MRKPILLGLVGLLGACAGGGGGGEPAPSPTVVAVAVPSPASIPADLTRDLAGESRDYVEAYARAPWVHANAASGNWQQAASDMRFVQERLADLHADEDVRPSLKERLGRLTPLLDRLDAQIEDQEPQAVQTAAELVVRFSALTNQPEVQAWLGLEAGGGGGPSGSPSPRR